MADTPQPTPDQSPTFLERLLGTGMARRAGEDLKNRKSKIDSEVERQMGTDPSVGREKEK